LFDRAVPELLLFVRVSESQYGTKKNVMFHDDSFITQLKKSDTNRVVSLDAGTKEWMD